MSQTTTQETRIHRIPIVSLDEPRYASLARLVRFPDPDPALGGKYFPAVAGFNVGSGSDVDISYYYSFRSEPSGGFDRHLRTEEVFVVLEGDFCIPLAACRDPDDPDEVPRPQDFVATIVRQGEALILRPNVWHSGGWVLDPAKGVRFLMILNGHRVGSGHEGRVDHIVKRFPEGVAIEPDWDSAP